MRSAAVAQRGLPEKDWLSKGLGTQAEAMRWISVVVVADACLSLSARSSGLVERINPGGWAATIGDSKA